jgi:hypothetical protein
MTANNLINKYSDLRDELMDYTMDHFDSMGYDISGYYNDEIDIERLKQQVKAFELMLKAYKLLDYKYG